MDQVSGLLPLALLIGVFYFLLIRPQQRRVRQHRQLVQSIEVGDEVVTIGGMYGEVKRMDDSTMWIEVADGTVARFSRQAVSQKVTPEVEVEESSQPEGSE